ncbi:helix-turn-helix domain-containing protein [Actinoplanes sp. CA-051413]|uniref:helix-turn-helix domain-containing protein n=1 Tax=Actinoplanes sp. CA-051413 TaxID=3239899 RepID=UPI003D99519F
MTRTKSNGAEIRRLREAQGVGCPQLADKVGIDRRFLNKIENGLQDGSPATRLKIAQALGVDLTQITYTVPTQRRAEQAA